MFGINPKKKNTKKAAVIRPAAKKSAPKKRKKKAPVLMADMEMLHLKETYLAVRKKTGWLYTRRLRRWYKKNQHKLWMRMKLRRLVRRLAAINISSKVLSAVRWVIIDFLRAKPTKFWGIYQFVALPGEGKTLSMVAQMERVRKKFGAGNIFIATNFCYKNQNMAINHWTDMIKASTYANDHNMHSIVALDEIHTTFDASDWKSFPQEMLSLLSFNRKYGMQFLCSAQIYERIPRKVRDIANYTVICKNTLGLDRHFVNYYYSKSNYDEKFAGKRRLCEFIRTYVAGDDLYDLYDTLQQVEKMTADAMSEKQKQQEAFELLFGRQGGAEFATD